jgi:polyamine oxidase
MRIAGAMPKDCRNVESGCGGYTKYELLHGTTELAEYDAYNGIGVSPFYVADARKEAGGR